MAHKSNSALHIFERRIRLVGDGVFENKDRDPEIVPVLDILLRWQTENHVSATRAIDNGWRGFVALHLIDAEVRIQNTAELLSAAPVTVFFFQPVGFTAYSFDGPETNNRGITCGNDGLGLTRLNWGKHQERNKRNASEGALDCFFHRVE